MDTSSNDNWKFSNRTYSKSLLKFVAQTILIYIIILTSILNISLKNGNENIWIGLLSYSIGVMMNAPKLKNKLNILEDVARV